MFRKTISALLIVSLLSWTLGCTHTHFVTQEPVIERFDEINKATWGRKAQIVLVSGDIFDGEDIHVSSVLTYWYIPGTDIEKNVQTTDIKEIVFMVGNPGTGGFVGALVGASIGALAALAEPESKGWGPDFPDELMAFIGGLVGGIPGGVVGAAIGLQVKSEERYVFLGPAAHPSEK